MAVTIDVWSDVVCPFCYIGKKKLDFALEKLNATEKVEVKWHSFQLNPNMPNYSQNALQYLAETKNIPLPNLKQMTERISDMGKPYGIAFAFDKSLVFNTFPSHQLLHWAQSKGLGNKLNDLFFSSVFEKGLDLSSETQLLDLVSDCGLDKTEALEVLKKVKYKAEIEKDQYDAFQLGCKGVPYFLINNKAVISGAQDDRVFTNILSTALQNRFNQDF